MGGRGSGRRNGKPTIEGRRCQELPISYLIRNGLRIGQRITIKFEPVGGRFWADIEADLIDDRSPHLVLRYLPRTRDHGFVCEHQRVAVAATRTPFGGRRWWFLCPETGKRVGILYLPEGERRFLSREGYGLGYESQRMTTEQRHRRRSGIGQPMISSKTARSRYR